MNLIPLRPNRPPLRPSPRNGAGARGNPGSPIRRSLPLLVLAAAGACASPPTAPPQAAGPPATAWIAHRGYSSVAPENTLAAVRAALALAETPAFVEIDVHRTADGHLAVIHDGTLERTTDRAGEVAKLSWDEVRGADAGYADRFGPEFRAEPVPSLVEVLDAVAGSSAGVMIEVKPGGLGAEVARLVAERGESAKHLVASFVAEVVLDAKLTSPELRTLYLVGEPGAQHVELARRMECTILGVSRGSITAELVELTHGAGLELWAYTVDDPDEARALLALGVDGIISDRVEAVRAGARE